MRSGRSSSELTRQSRLTTDPVQHFFRDSPARAGFFFAKPHAIYRVWTARSGCLAVSRKRRSSCAFTSGKVLSAEILRRSSTPVGLCGAAILTLL